MVQRCVFLLFWFNGHIYISWLLHWISRKYRLSNVHFSSIFHYKQIAPHFHIFSDLSNYSSYSAGSCGHLQLPDRFLHTRDIYHFFPHQVAFSRLSKVCSTSSTNVISTSLCPNIFNIISLIYETCQYTIFYSFSDISCYFLNISDRFSVVFRDNVIFPPTRWWKDTSAFPNWHSMVAMVCMIHLRSPEYANNHTL
jgi:hypothetical protein